MTIKEVYEKFKHLDPVIENFVFTDPIYHLAYDLWQAIKEEAEKEKP